MPDREAIDCIHFHFLNQKDCMTLKTMKDEAKTTTGIYLLGASVGTDAIVASVLKAKMARIETLLAAVVSLADPHISTHTNRLCASVVHNVHIFKVTHPSQALPLTTDFEKMQKGLFNRPSLDIPALSPDSFH